MDKQINIKNLKILRNDLGISQEEMAEKLGYSSKSGYSMLENGNVSISLDKANKIAKIFGKSISEIFFD